MDIIPESLIMIEEIIPNLYRIEIPLPGNPLKSLNSYLIKTPERFLIIDTGMNRDECLQEMYDRLEMLSVDLNRTDFFITHLHADHLGLTSRLATDRSTVYFNEIEEVMVNSGDKEQSFNETGEFHKSNGFPADELDKVIAAHPGLVFSGDEQRDYHILKERDNLGFGEYCFEVIETPGHSPGHLSLYESKKKILIAGDTVLFDITPNINTWHEFRNPLKQYLQSLDKIYHLDVDMVLPGHRSIAGNHRKRIDELKAHHEARLNEVLCALETGDKNAYQVAPYISWDISYSDWESFPPVPKLFAMGETIAHLDYLEGNKMISSREEDGIVIHSLV
jgi:glyoxylase-like metal-dependent hydrolase (beta-lactamase superfamily II)